VGLRSSIIAMSVALAAVACRAPSPGSEVAVQWGTFGVADTEQLFIVGAEYRWRPLWEELRPMVGLAQLEDGAEYFYAGMRYDIELSEHVELSPSFAPGIYLGETFDLGGPIEFRSGLDLRWRLGERWKVGVGAYHLSNGGLYSDNGGSEALLFSLAYAF